MNPGSPVTTVDIGGKPYPLAFTTMAASNLETYLRKQGAGTVGDLFKRLADGTAGIDDILNVFWCSLEGGRIRQGTRVRPYSREEVANLFDEMGGIVAIAAARTAVLEAISAATPNTEKPAEGKTTTDGGADPNAKTGSGTGKHSSKQRKKRK